MKQTHSVLVLKALPTEMECYTGCSIPGNEDRVKGKIGSTGNLHFYTLFIQVEKSFLQNERGI